MDLLRNSIATPSLVAAITNAKYTNAIPLYRISQEFERSDLMLSRATMANWVIRCSERYLSLVYDRLREYLCQQKVLQVDETTCQVTKDGRASNTKSYMFVYRTSELSKVSPVILYDYQAARIIIDEYDTPIQQGYMKGYYDQAVLFMRNLFSGGLKDNRHLSYGFLT